MRRALLILFILAFFISPPGQGHAGDELKGIPNSLLSDSVGSELREVIDGATFAGEKRDVVFKGHRVVYEFLLDHLDFTSQIARVLDLSDYVIEQTAEGTYEATTPRGGWALLHVVYTDDQKRVVLAQGRYGRAVVVLQYTAFEHRGESYVINDLYGYVRADHPIFDLLLSFMGGIFEYRVAQIFTNVAELSERAYEAPASFSQELSTHGELRPSHLREFAKILKRLPSQEAPAYLPM